MQQEGYVSAEEKGISNSVLLTTDHTLAKECTLTVHFFFKFLHIHAVI